MKYSLMKKKEREYFYLMESDLLAIILNLLIQVDLEGIGR